MSFGSNPCAVCMAGFEQSVGTFIDGVYYGRARNSRAAFLDLERIEVLKAWPDHPDHHQIQ